MTWFSNAKLVLENEIVQGDLTVEGDKITGINSQTFRSQQAIDCEGDFLMPGLIELHTDNVERHFMPRPGTYWPNGLAAVLAHDSEIIGAGITTVYDALSVGSYDGANSPRATLFADMVDSIEQANALGLAKAEHRLHFRCELTDEYLMDMLRPLAERQDLSLISLMDHTPGQRQWRDLDALRTYMSRTGKSIEVINEMIQERIDKGAQFVSGNWQAVLDLFEGRDLVFASHDDTTEEDVALAARSGIAISEFPCSLEAARLASRSKMANVGGAPNIVRGGSHSGNVSIIDLAKEGILHGLSSDYAPSSLLQAPFVISKALDQPLWQSLQVVTCGVADMLGLGDRGRLEVGKRADLIRVAYINETPMVKAAYVAGQRVA